MKKNCFANVATFALVLALGSTVSLSAIGRAADPDGPACEIANVAGAGDLHQLLSHRAAEVIDLAAGPSWQNDTELSKLVTPTAEFNIGAGDVGRPLGVGIQGARALAVLSNADRFRFFNWDYMNFPVNPCGVSKVTVEFINSESNESAEIEFEFNAGRVTAARGWQKSFSTGALTPVSK